MGKKHKKVKKRNAVFERKADERTARFVAARLGEIREDLSDLMADLRTFDHYEQVVDVSLCVWCLQRVKRKYEKFADQGTWDDEKE